MKESKKQIAEIVCRFYKRHDGTVQYRKAPRLDASAIFFAQTFIRKPLFKSWRSLIPEIALTCPPIFERFAPRIFMTFKSGKGMDWSWDGDGNLQPHAHLQKFFELQSEQEFWVFKLLLAEEIYCHLEKYLEDPSQPLQPPVHLTLIRPRPTKPPVWKTFESLEHFDDSQEIVKAVAANRPTLLHSVRKLVPLFVDGAILSVGIESHDVLSLDCLTAPENKSFFEEIASGYGVTDIEFVPLRREEF